MREGGQSPKAPGPIIARLLAGAWRPGAPPPEVGPSELAQVANLLHQTGTGALAWWRVRGTPLEHTETTEGLRQAYRIHALEAVRHAVRTVDALDRLDAAAIEPLLVKGWAVARHYPEVGLRSYTDLDLIVPPGRGPVARAALTGPPDLGYPVDLHDGLANLYRFAFEDLAERAEVASLRGRPVLVLCPEDSLRLLALHALRHGVFRPLWLIDLAVEVECRPAGFDWGRCLGPDRRRADWVLCAVALAHRLLGARVEGTPAEARAATLPRWFVQAVLRNWARGDGRSHMEPVFRAFVARLGHPAELWSEARLRWDRPIEATLEVGAPMNGLPRWPFQVGAVVRRSPELIEALRDRAAARRVDSAPRRGTGTQPERAFQRDASRSS
jgi:Uncharacterised nucleotidyltransferase